MHIRPICKAAVLKNPLGKFLIFRFEVIIVNYQSINLRPSEWWVNVNIFSTDCHD